MATISFNEDLSVNDNKKIMEIAQALKSPRDEKIRPAQPPKLTDKSRKLWFKR